MKHTLQLNEKMTLHEIKIRRQNTKSKYQGKFSITRKNKKKKKILYA